MHTFNKIRLVSLNVIVLSFVLFFLSCSSEVGYTGKPMFIGFRSIFEKTKAQETNADNIADCRVWAVWVKDRLANDYYPNFMEGVKVTRSGNDWEYSPKRYMPLNGSVDFFAYSPARSTGVSSFVIEAPSFDKAVITYINTTDQRMQDDFLVASAIEQKTNNVTMNFHHALSQVEFKARSGVKGSNFRIRKIELLNLDREGTLSGVFSTPPSSEVDWEWSDNINLTEKTDIYPLYIPSPMTVTYPIDATQKPDFESLTDIGVGNLMLLPQPIVNIGEMDLYTQDDIDFDENDSITHGMLGQPKDIATGFYIAATVDSESIYYPGTGAIPFHSNATIYIPLYNSLGVDGVVGGGDDIPFEFEMGKKYTFLLELKELDEVTFIVDELDWETTVEIPL